MFGFKELPALQRASREKTQHPTSLPKQPRVRDLVVLAPAQRKEPVRVSPSAGRKNQVVVEGEVIRETDVKVVPEDLDPVHVEAGPEIVQTMTRRHREQAVECPIGCRP